MKQFNDMFPVQKSLYFSFISHFSLKEVLKKGRIFLLIFINTDFIFII